MPDQQDPYERLQRIEQAVSLLAAAVAEMKRDLSPPSTEPPPDRQRHLHPLAALIALPVGAWALMRERVQATLVAAGVAVVAGVAGYVLAPSTDGPEARVTPTANRPSASTPTHTGPPSPADRTSGTAPPRETTEEPAAERPAASPARSFVDDPATDPAPTATRPEPTTPPGMVTAPPGDVDDGVEEVVRPPRRCLTVKLGDLPLRVCRRG